MTYYSDLGMHLMEIHSKKWWVDNALTVLNVQPHIVSSALQNYGDWSNFARYFVNEKIAELGTYSYATTPIMGGHAVTWGAGVGAYVQNSWGLPPETPPQDDQLDFEQFDDPIGALTRQFQQKIEEDFLGSPYAPYAPMSSVVAHLQHEAEKLGIKDAKVTTKAEVGGIKYVVTGNVSSIEMIVKFS